MVVFTYTQVDTVLGKLTNGRKLVMTEVTITSGGLDLTTVTVKPLKRIVQWTLGLAKPATDTFVTAAHASQLNGISITPSGDATNDILQIFSVGE
jgi:hypothetical protein